MKLNKNINFVIISNFTKEHKINNVNFEFISWEFMKKTIFNVTSTTPKYNFTYKSNDFKPLLPFMFPKYLKNHDFWGWSDLDIFFGNIEKFIIPALSNPSCCKTTLRNGKPITKSQVNIYAHRNACTCDKNTTSDVFSPLFPNPFLKKVWGPLTVFKINSNLRSDLFFQYSKFWKHIVTSNIYNHFDEFWGNKRKFKTMGDVVDSLAYNGIVNVSKSKVPFAEAKRCTSECYWCPCGALHMKFVNNKLIVNNIEVLLLHLSESKFAFYNTILPNNVSCLTGLGNINSTNKYIHLKLSKKKNSRHRMIHKFSKYIYYPMANKNDIALKSC